MAAVGRMLKVEWSWVKGHSGYLLDECADMLATKGVNNETPYSNVQYLHPINEDTDTEVYVLREGEETSVGNWKGDTLPEHTYVMKDGENLQEYLSREPTPESTLYPSDPISDVQSEVQSELEDSDTPPPPPESEDELCVISCPPPQQQPVLGPKLHWW
jgi:hypothetical protein